MESNTMQPLYEYLFCAEFADGSTIHQTQKDISQHEAGRNAFYDVLQRQGDLVGFSLIGVHRPYNVYRVSLLDGSFTFNGADFQSTWGEGPLSNFRVIYFTIRQKYANDENTDSKIVGYLIGFQANREDGSNIQRIHTVRS